MGWRIILVDEDSNARNGGHTTLKSGKMAEEEAYARAAKHNSVTGGPKIISVVCVADENG